MEIKELVDSYILNRKMDEGNNKIIKLFLTDNRDFIEEAYEASLEAFYDPEYYHILKQREADPISAYAEELEEDSGFEFNWLKNSVWLAVMVERMYIDTVELLPQKA